MKKRIQFALLLSAISSGLHFYLTKRSYEIQAGQARASQICNINETLNCDAVLTSSYSSLRGFPLTNFGFALNLFLGLILLGLLIQFLELSDYWKNITLYISGFLSLSSIVMFGISVSIKAFCPVCLLLYLLSFLLFAILLLMFRKDYQKTFLLDSIKNKSSLASIACIALLSVFLHMTFVNQFNLKELKKINKLVYIDWMQAQVESFNHPPTLQKGNPNSSLTITEFADPLCSHCKRAHYAVKKFLKSYPNVNFQMYLFPLDKACNSNMQYTRGGRSCQLSHAILCGKEQNKGWEIHDLIFEKQDIFSAQSSSQVLKIIENEVENIDMKKLSSCMSSSNTQSELEKQTSVGIHVEIPGTPSFFINRKRIHTNEDLHSTFLEFYKKLVK